MPRWPQAERMPLAQLRNKAGYTIETAAVAAGITSKCLSRYEHGMADITLKVAENLAVIYKVPFNDIRQAVKDTERTTG